MNYMKSLNDPLVLGVSDIKITLCQAHDVKCQLQREMDQFPAIPIQFNGFVHSSGGWIEILCANEETLEWLLRRQHVFAKDNYVTNQQSNKIYFYKLTNYMLCTIKLINYNDKFDVLKRRLEIQNPGLSTHSWRYIKDKTYENCCEQECRKFLFEVDSDSVSYLEDCEWYLFFNLGKIKLKQFNARLFKKGSNSVDMTRDFAKTLFGKDELKGKFFVTDIMEEIKQEWMTFAIDTKTETNKRIDLLI